MSEINNLVGNLVEILRKKKQNLLSMLNFTQLQTDAIEEKADDRLLELFEKKQQLIEAIDELDKDFIKGFDLLKGILGVQTLDELTGDRAAELKPLRFELDGIYMLLEQIVSIETQNNVKIQAEHADIKEKLKKINEGKNVMNAYGNKLKSSGGAFFDTKK